MWEGPDGGVRVEYKMCKRDKVKVFRVTRVTTRLLGLQVAKEVIRWCGEG